MSLEFQAYESYGDVTESDRGALPA